MSHSVSNFLRKASGISVREVLFQRPKPPLENGLNRWHANLDNFDQSIRPERLIALIKC